MSVANAAARITDERLSEPLPFVRAALSYMVPMPERPRSYMYEPPAGVPELNARYEPHQMVIRNLRPVAAKLSLDAEGFRFLHHPSAVRNFYDEDELRSVYYPEVEHLVAQATGAVRVVVFDHTIRRHTQSKGTTAGKPLRMPVPRVHNDYTVKSGPQRVRDLLGDEAEALLGRHFSIINVWRPIRGPLEDSPLALCDARSVPFEDLIATDLLYKDRTGEIYYIHHNPAHRWYYAPRMTRDEVLLLRCYDSEQDGRARFVPHAAFIDPTTPRDVLPRESIELRTLVFY
jgi:hypothetical protein